MPAAADLATDRFVLRSDGSAEDVFGGNDRGEEAALLDGGVDFAKMDEAGADRDAVWNGQRGDLVADFLLDFPTDAVF